MTTPVLSAFLNPVAETLTLYFPNLRSGTRYAPADDETVLYSVPVSAPVIVIVALGTTAPVLSRIVPARVPRSDCANPVIAEAANKETIATPFPTQVSQRIVFSPSLRLFPFHKPTQRITPVPAPDLIGRSEQGAIQRFFSRLLVLEQSPHFRGGSL